jgi:hypothetical protein
MYMPVFVDIIYIYVLRLLSRGFICPNCL